MEQISKYDCNLIRAGKKNVKDGSNYSSIC